MRMACTALSMVPWAVTRMTATSALCSARRPSSSMPPMRGILRSVITIDGDHWVAFSSPSAPSRAVSTRNPQEPTSSARPERSFSSSSTISTFSWLIGLIVPVSLKAASGEFNPVGQSPDCPSGRIPTIRGRLPARQGLDGQGQGQAPNEFQFETKPAAYLRGTTSSLRFRFRQRCDRILRSQSLASIDLVPFSPHKLSVAWQLGNHNILEDSMKFSSATRECRRLMIGLSALIAVFVISGSAFAQDSSTPNWDIFVGYQYLNPGATVPTPGGDPNNPTPYPVPAMSKGVGVAAAYNFDPHWGLEGDFGYNRDTSAENSEWTASGGPRFVVHDESARFFIHALAGLNRATFDSGLANHYGVGLILGGGMDLTITKKISWRLFQVDYVWAAHNFSSEAAPEFPSLRRPQFQGERLRTGIVFTLGGAPAAVPAAACSVQPAEVMVGEPITATVTASNFNPKHTVTYGWTGNGGGQITGKDTGASIDTTNATPGSYTITATVTDPKSSKNNVASCTANYTIKPLPPKN